MAAKSSCPSTERMRSVRDSPDWIAPPSITTRDATLSLSPRLETSMHSMREGGAASPRRAASAAAARSSSAEGSADRSAASRFRSAWRSRSRARPRAGTLTWTGLPRRPDRTSSRSPRPAGSTGTSTSAGTAFPRS